MLTSLIDFRPNDTCTDGLFALREEMSQQIWVSTEALRFRRFFYQYNNSGVDMNSGHSGAMTNCE